MTYTTAKLTVHPASNHSVSIPSFQLPTNCHNCPYFNNFKDNRGRGWCNQQNRHSFTHHVFTPDCELNLLSDEDLNCYFEQGDKVKIISADLDHSQWATYIVISKRYHPDSNEADWEYFLSSPSQPTTGLFWVAENHICDYSTSHAVNPEGEF